MKHSLVVDDSRIIRKIASSILGEFEFETAEAEDGAGALEVCRAHMPDLILLDWNIPNSSVFEFLRGLRREPGGGHPIVVYCTTENDVGRISEAMVAGATDYILKPYDRETVTEKLTQLGLA